ncbi:sulfite exporter TauE/SafE [Nitzschia inconspicua]|uniref:Sulfite exporter TauE/SafE n=1 Tax=Nitzschia inconspicua TaxID=303405 RepID=A0A9K3P8A9_9STRA|nr:sulfite exporter TauE/SafE [Nitzschia inconspicua]KAG7361194.1 sulfite exporter TauE/SafE [Nitzschia inconspicua]
MGRMATEDYTISNTKDVASSTTSFWTNVVHFWKTSGSATTKHTNQIYQSFSLRDDDDDDDDDKIDRDHRDRDLKSESNSRDSHDEHDDFWRNPDYWDDYIGNNRDDDFYKYIGDPTPPSLLPLTRRDVIGFMLASLGATLGSSGGIGGGGLVVPCYIIAIGLSPKQAFPIGSVTVLGGALASLILNLRRRHPLADRPIIDWDLILVMEPLVLVGALFGSILHRVVAEKILSVLLVLLLSTVAHTTLRKARRMYDAERRYIEHLKTARSDYLSRVASFRTAFRMSEAGWSADALAGMDPESRTVSASYLPPSPVRTQSLDSRSMNTTTPVSPRMDAHERQRILILNPDFVTLRSDLLEEEKVTPRSKIMALCAKFSVLIFLNITLGGGAFRSPWGIECGGLSFWVVHVIMVAFLVSSAWAAQTYLINRHELKEIIRFDYVHGDIKWDPRTAIIYPFFFILAGTCAGMFGIGGGMITVPLMLAMGVHPAICTATSSTMVFFTALLSASSFAVFNLILWDYAIVCFFIGFIGCLIGQGIMQKARQTSTGSANFERNSFIAYCTGSVIMLCALLMTLQYVLQLVGFDKNRSYYYEGGLCDGYMI